MLEFIKRGYIVSVPYGDCARYDFVVDNGSQLFKIQVKTVSKKSNTNTYTINNYSIGYGKTRSRKKYEKHEIDFVCVFLISANKCLSIPIQHFDNLTLNIRDDMDFPNNGMEKNVHYISDYNFDVYFPSLIRNNNSVK